MRSVLRQSAYVLSPLGLVFRFQTRQTASDEHNAGEQARQEDCTLRPGRPTNLSKTSGSQCVQWKMALRPDLIMQNIVMGKGRERRLCQVAFKRPTCVWSGMATIVGPEERRIHKMHVCCRRLSLRQKDDGLEARVLLSTRTIRLPRQNQII